MSYLSQMAAPNHQKNKNKKQKQNLEEPINGAQAGAVKDKSYTSENNSIYSYTYLWYLDFTP